MSAIYILWLRELKRYTRSRAQIVASLGQPLLYLLVLGFGLGPVFQRAGNGNYFQFVAPGVISMSVLFLVDLFRTRPALGPPVRISEGDAGGAGAAHSNHDRPHAGRMHGRRDPGLLVTTISVIAGFRPANYYAIPIALGFMLLIALLFAAVGVAIGSGLQDMQGFQLIMNFLVLPIYFLSGAMFPLADQKLPLSIATGIDPLSYGVDGLRSALLGSLVSRPVHGFHGACGARVHSHDLWRVALLEDRDLSHGPTPQRRGPRSASSARRSICLASAASTPPAWTRSHKPPA